jgi:hypothetical protein
MDCNRNDGFVELLLLLLLLPLRSMSDSSQLSSHISLNKVQHSLVASELKKGFRAFTCIVRIYIYIYSSNDWLGENFNLVNEIVIVLTLYERKCLCASII